MVLRTKTSCKDSTRATNRETTRSSVSKYLQASYVWGDYFLTDPIQNVTMIRQG